MFTLLAQRLSVHWGSQLGTQCSSWATTDGLHSSLPDQWTRRALPYYPHSAFQ